MDAFSAMGPSITDTLVTAMTKLSGNQEAMDNRLVKFSKISKNAILLQQIS